MEAFELDNFLPYRLNRAAEAASRGFATLYRARHHMTRPEWRVLALLGAVGGLAAAQIVRRTAMHKTKVSRAVAALERRGWLRRVTDKADRRIEHLELTPAGHGALDELTQLAREYETALRARIGEAGVAALDAGLAAIMTMAPPPGADPQEDDQGDGTPERNADAPLAAN